MSDVIPYSTDDIDQHLDWAIDSYDLKEIAHGYARLLKPEDPVELLLVIDLAKARHALVHAELRRDSVYQVLENDARKAFSLKLAAEARNLVKKWLENPAEHHLLRTSSLAIQSLMQPWEALKAFTQKTTGIATWSLLLPCVRAEGHTGLTPNPNDLGWSLIKAANPSDVECAGITIAPLQLASDEERSSIKFLLKNLNENKITAAEGKNLLIKIADKHLCILENDYQQALEAEAKALDDFIAGYSTKECRESLRLHQSDIRTLTVRFNQILRMFNTLRQQRLRKSSRGKSSGGSGSGSSSGHGGDSGSRSSNSSGSGTSGTSSGASQHSPTTPENRPTTPAAPIAPEMQSPNANATELQLNLESIPDFNSNATDNAIDNETGNATGHESTLVDIVDSPAPEPLRPVEAKRLESRILMGFHAGISDEQMARFFAGWEDWRMNYSDEELQKFFSNVADRQAVLRYMQLFQAEKARRLRRSQTPGVA